MAAYWYMYGIYANGFVWLTSLEILLKHQQKLSIHSLYLSTAMTVWHWHAPPACCPSAASCPLWIRLRFLQVVIWRTDHTNCLTRLPMADRGACTMAKLDRLWSQNADFVILGLGSLCWLHRTLGLLLTNMFSCSSDFEVGTRVTRSFVLLASLWNRLDNQL